MKFDAQAAHRQAVEVAAKQIARLSEKPALTGWDGADLERYANICKGYDDHELKWMAKLDPSALPEELLNRVLAQTEEGEADGARAKRSKRAATSA